MPDISFTRRRLIVAGSAAVAVVALIEAAGLAGCYWLALSALHNHSNLSVQQSCSHWEMVYRATSPGTRLHAAIGRIVTRELECGR